MLGTIRNRAGKFSGPVLFRWFVSYLAILIIPLVLSAAVYFYSLNIINKSSGEIYEASLEQFRIEIDNFLDSASQTLQQLSLNASIQSLTAVSSEFQPQDHWNIIQAINEIQKIKYFFPVIYDIFVVLNPLESAMNSAAFFPIDFFYRLFYENETIDAETYKAIMMKPQRSQIVQVKDKLFLFQPGVDTVFPGASKTLAIVCDKETFDDRFFSSFELNGSRIFIVQGNGHAVYSTGENGSLPFYYGNHESGYRGIIDNASYRVLSMESRVNNWTYLYFIPVSLEQNRARQIQLFTFIGLFICSLLGLFLSFFLSRRHYDPVMKLMSVFGHYEKPPKGEDEFLWIEKKALDTQAALGSNLLALRKYFIHTLLEKPFDPVNGKYEMERYGINLKGEWNIVAIFMSSFSSSGGTLSENESEISNALPRVIADNFTEAADNDFSVEVIGVGEYAAAIINWSGDKSFFISRLEDKIEYIQQKASESLHLPIMTALGEPRRGPEGIFYSSLEARETLGFLDPATGQSILHYNDIKYSGGKYRYTYETEQKLISLVRLGDSEAACDLLRQIWAENSDAQNRPGRTGRLLAYNLLGSLAKSMELDSIPDDFLPHGFNLDNIPPENLAGILEKTAVEICKSNSILRQERRKRRLSVKVKEYIDENFRNPDINISITSHHFNMNPRYLATVFKDETGTSLLEYINTLRIEEGKKLLRSGCEVNEAAGRCGFRGSGAFIRVFKKLTGVTPGQYV